MERPEQPSNWEELPRVTTVLQAAGIINFDGIEAGVLNTARDRGTAVHRMLQYYDEGDLDEDLAGYLESWEDLAGYLESWKKFRGETGFEPRLIEQEVWHLGPDYRGHIDRWGTTTKGKFPLVDIKSGAEQPSHVIQISAYYRALQFAFPDEAVTDAWLVYLNRGGYKVKEVPLYEATGSHYNLFMSALAIYTWRREHGLIAA